MAKKNKKFKIEKQLNSKLKGFDFSDFETYGVRGIDIYRYAMIQFEKEHKSPKEMKLLSEIRFIENRMLERELNQKADELLLKELYDELEDIKGFNKDKKQWLIKAIEDEFNDYLESNDERYTDYKDLTSFYKFRKDAISNRASKVGRTYEQAVELFDAYFEKIADEDIIENTRTSEHE